ncbi:PH domain-containing protein [Stackebrandtia soli]|uniref:PH domain-containing protein n=1 Tax=Stackebrandtia soli TaxID=1892856 RepID=UPI0039EA5672
MEPRALQWRVPRHIITAKIAATAIFALVALWYADDSARFLVAAFAAIILASYALRDLINPVRLTADADGVRVSRGFFGERRLAWGEISRIRVDERRRLAGTSVLLEIDIDTTLFLFSKSEIGEDPAEAAATLNELRQETTSAP